MAYPHPPTAGYSATPVSPFHAPRYSVFTATPSPRGPSKGHARRASTFEPSAHAYSARTPSQHAGASARQHATPQSTPLRTPEYVSGFGYAAGQSPSRSPRASSGTKRRKASYSYERADLPRSFDRQYFYRVYAGEDDYYYAHREAPPPYEELPSYARAGTDPRFYYDQVPQYTEAAREPMPSAKANQSRQRRASTAHASRPMPPKPQPSKPTPPAKAPSRRANEEDARRAGIPAGYSTKNWDPNEEPIMLLGSVFDANSLGKWIYDWTVFSYGPATPMSDVAGDLWLLLIQLAGKVKRADEAIELIRQEENRELVEDFLESGERLWVRFKKLLKVCEEYMWKAAQKETGEKRPINMGKNSGCEFVDSIFGRDRELDKTEKLMSAVRLWSMRFDANCDEILRNPKI